MKRTALLATVALVAVSPAVAHAGAKASTRTLTYAYQGFQAANADGVGSTSAENPCAVIDACWDFTTVKGEKTVKVTMVDGSGQAAGFQIFADDDYNSVVTFCGSGVLTVSPKTAASISVRPTISSTCTAVPTSGTLTAVITNK
ncbi:MAG: hypothetical protein QOJ79_1159 [Actinomycetota bacterium]|nr:hypothetical protein [Actinomycetota bacterium]